MCFCSLIFAYRYKAVDSSRKKFVAKTLVFSAVIITISVFQVFFDHLYTVFILPIQKQECFYLNYDLKEHLVYIIVMVGCLFLMTVLQTRILTLTLRPIRNHVNNISSISNERMYSMMKRTFFCTLLFAASDFGLVILQLVMVKNIGRPMSILLLSNLNLNCFSLVISYGDYKNRLFPFIKFENDKDGKISSPHVKSKASKINDKQKNFWFIKNKHVKREEKIEMQEINSVSKNISNDLAKILHQNM